MQHRWPIAIAASLAVLFAAPADAAAKKKTPAKSAGKASTKKAPAKKDEKPVVAEAVTPGGFMVPKEVVLKGPTLLESQANAIWSIRAGLNVAALQCQFSQYLQTVKNYNNFIKNHAEELASAQVTMQSHFKRVDGARGAASFDQYNTKMYNSFSTLDAQYRFCDAAGHVGREVLAVARGQLGPAALKFYPEMRGSLSNQPLSPALAFTRLEPLVLPEISF